MDSSIPSRIAQAFTKLAMDAPRKNMIV